MKETLAAYNKNLPVNYATFPREALAEYTKSLPLAEITQVIVDFTMAHPDYGQDGNGIWFE